MFGELQLYIPMLWSILSLFGNENLKFRYISTTTVNPNIYSVEELAALQQFRPLVKNLTENNYERTDEFMIRWLRARNLDAESANRMLREAKNWRKENKIDSILSEHMPIKSKQTGCFYSGLDYEGNPVSFLGFVVSFLRIGGFDVRKFVLAGQTEKLFRLVVQCLETSVLRLYNVSHGTGRNVSQALCIADFTGFSLAQQACKSCFQFYVNLMQAVDKYYPGLTKMYVAINVPRSAKAGLNLVLSLVPKSILQVPMKVFGTNRNEWLPFLLKLMPADQLLIDYGGSMKAS